jgi:hypothetical protein
MNTVDLPIIVAQWERSANDTVMVKIDRFNGNIVIDIRAWWRSRNGQLRAGRSGITMSVKHLPALACALTKAETIARQPGFLTEPDPA